MTPTSQPSPGDNSRKTPTGRQLQRQIRSGKPERPSLSRSGATSKQASGIVVGKQDRKFEESEARITAQSVGLPYINLFGFPVELEALKTVSKQESESSRLAPFLLADDQLRLGTTKPLGEAQKKVLQRLKKEGFQAKVYFVSGASFKHIVGFYENIIAPKKQIKTGVSLTEEELEKFKLSVPSLREVKKRAASATVTEIIDLLIAAALQLDASDIHLEPSKKMLRVRYRIDGILHDTLELPQSTHKQLISRIKLLAKLKLNVSKIAQDGRFSVQTSEHDIDVRVSILPSQYGEAIVMRLLGIGSLLLDIKDLGLRDYGADVINAELKKPNGMILTTGPTGSGKTTTLYSFVNALNTPDIKIITLEDPIEYRLEGIEQTQIEEAEGYTFAKGLRSILRQDPDVLLIGEIRDLETAETSVSAALTGHIVFSTLHTNDAAGALPRMIDMGVRPFVLAPAINAIIAQRLVRRVCQKCFKKVAPTTDQVEYIRAVLGPDMAKHLPKSFTVAEPEGCEECNFIGYKGRMGIFEVFKIDDAMEKLILSASSTAEIKEAAVAQGMILMVQDGVLKVLDHITTITEVQRVT